MRLSRNNAPKNNKAMICKNVKAPTPIPESRLGMGKDLISGAPSSNPADGWFWIWKHDFPPQFSCYNTMIENTCQYTHLQHF